MTVRRLTGPSLDGYSMAGQSLRANYPTGKASVPGVFYPDIPEQQASDDNERPGHVGKRRRDSLKDNYGKCMKTDF